MTTKDKGITLPASAVTSAKGTLVLSNSVNTVVNNTGVLSTSQIRFEPTNAAAAALMGSAKSLYVSAKTVGVSFTLSTANGVAAAGTETFDYTLVF